MSISARAADAELRRRRVRGPLPGIPYGAKDLFDTIGVKTTFGAGPYRDRVADRDATVISKLRDADAVLVAKTSLGALAYGDFSFDGRTRNPWNPPKARPRDMTGDDGLPAWARWPVPDTGR